MIEGLETDVRDERSGRSFCTWRVALLVALCVLIGACRASEDSARTVTITRPAAGVPFDRVFTWKPVSGASSYEMAIYSAGGTRSFEVRDLASAGVKLSDSLKLPPGRYSVQVTAFREGKPIAESPMIPFDLK